MFWYRLKKGNIIAVRVDAALCQGCRRRVGRSGPVALENGGVVDWPTVFLEQKKKLIHDLQKLAKCIGHYKFEINRFVKPTMLSLIDVIGFFHTIYYQNVSLVSNMPQGRY